MDPEDYLAFTRTTAIYPGAGTGSEAAMDYLRLGLVSEVGEIAGKLKKVRRDCGGVLTPELLEAIRDETADVLWYLARLLDEAGLTLAHTTPFWHALPFPDAPLAQSVIERRWWNLNAATAQPALLSGHLTEPLLRLHALAASMDSNLADLARRNADKLASRRDRGVLTGSGDHR